MDRWIDRKRQVDMKKDRQKQGNRQIESGEKDGQIDRQIERGERDGEIDREIESGKEMDRQIESGKRDGQIDRKGEREIDSKGGKRQIVKGERDRQ